MPKRNQKQYEKTFEQAGQLGSIDPLLSEWMASSGLEDGNVRDDKVRITRKAWAASDLKPSQSTMVLGKSLGMALFMLKTGNIGGDLGALVSSDNHIMDGHHRWSAAILAGGRDARVGGYGANLAGKYLLRVLNIVTKGAWKIQRGKKGSGNIKGYTPAAVRKVLAGFVKDGIPGEFPWSAEEVKVVLTSKFGSVEEGITAIADNVKLINKTVPSWAPNRDQMPVIDPDRGHVEPTVQKLQRGEVDWNKPYMKVADSGAATPNPDSSVHDASSDTLHLDAEPRNADWLRGKGKVSVASVLKNHVG